MDSIQFSEFSTTGVSNSDTFDVWRKKTNGVIDQLVTINDSISPLFYSAGQTQSALLRTVTLDDSQTITGAKTFSGGTKAFPILKVGTAGFYEDSGVLGTTGPFVSDRIIINSELQLGQNLYTIPNNNPAESSILEKSGSSLSWKTLSSIISVIQREGAAKVVTTNIVLPVGSIIDYALQGGSVPSNWLRCSGGRFNGGDYPELAALILNTYGNIYTAENGDIQGLPVGYNSAWWYTLPNTSGKIIKATPDSVVNTFIDRGNAFDIIQDGTSLQSFSLASGGTGILNLRHDNTLYIDPVSRELGVAPFSVGGDKITSNAIDPSKLSFGGPSWDTNSSLYEGSDPNTRARVATRDYVDSKTFKVGPVKKLVSRPAYSPYISAPSVGEFCYINDDGVPIITGPNIKSRFGFTRNPAILGLPSNDQYGHTEMPLPDNRRAAELYVTQTNMCALDENGELWVMGEATYNMFNIVPYLGLANNNPVELAYWTKAYTPLYNYSTNNKIRKVIISGDSSISNVAVIDTSNRLWVSGNNEFGVLGRGNSGASTTTAIKSPGENTPVLEDVLDAFLVGGWNGTNDCTICVALTPSGIRMSGYGGNGQSGKGNFISINSTFNTITLPDIVDYTGFDIYGNGWGGFTSIFIKAPNNILYAWGYGGNKIFGNNLTTTNKSSPDVIFDNQDFTIDRVYTTAEQPQPVNTALVSREAIYISGQGKNLIAQRGSDILATTRAGRQGDFTITTPISSDDSGNIISVGDPALARVQCYIYNNSTWVNYGQPIISSETTSLFGGSVSLSADASRLCIGAPDGQHVGTTQLGQVRVYDYSTIDSTWTQRGISFNGELNASKLGSSVALSGDGNTFIAGAPGHNNSTGRVYIRRITASGTETVGDPITGTATNQQCGIKVAINTSGTVIAIASYGISTAGVVRVYTLVANVWVQVGGDIVGRAAGDTAINISLNGSGTLLAVGAPGSAIGGADAGSTRVFSYSSQMSSWIQLGDDILGRQFYQTAFTPLGGEKSGSSVALSRDGAILAVGSPRAASINLNAGEVRTFKYDDGKWKLLTRVQQESGIATIGLGAAVAISASGTNILTSSTSNSIHTTKAVVRSIGFLSSPTTLYQVWCLGHSSLGKFGGSSNAGRPEDGWGKIGALPPGYDIKDFWVGYGYYGNLVNFMKAFRQSDGLYYLFVTGANTYGCAGAGAPDLLRGWLRLNLQSEVVNNIIDIQAIHSEVNGAYHTILHLKNGTIYFAGYNRYSIDPTNVGLETRNKRTNFTRIKI